MCSPVATAAGSPPERAIGSAKAAGPKHLAPTLSGAFYGNKFLSSSANPIIGSFSSSSESVSSRATSPSALAIRTARGSSMGSDFNASAILRAAAMIFGLAVWGAGQTAHRPSG